MLIPTFITTHASLVLLPEMEIELGSNGTFGLALSLFEFHMHTLVALSLNSCFQVFDSSFGGHQNLEIFKVLEVKRVK
jgi:hypothetical protein